MLKWLKSLFGKAPKSEQASAPEVLDEAALEIYFSTDPDLTAEELAEYDGALRAKFVEIATECGLLKDGVAEYCSDAYQPNDFCFKAFEYCGQQYDVTDTQEMIYEYIVTPFYGAIYATSRAAECAEEYKAAHSVWDAVAGKISMEFVPIRAREMLGLETDDPRAKEIYGIICRYKSEASDEAIVSSARRRVVCLMAMRYAYKLGMLVGRREFPVEGAKVIEEKAI